MARHIIDIFLEIKTLLFLPGSIICFVKIYKLAIFVYCLAHASNAKLHAKPHLCIVGSQRNFLDLYSTRS
jgi:hypothetical protein